MSRLGSGIIVSHAQKDTLSIELLFPLPFPSRHTEVQEILARVERLTTGKKGSLEATSTAKQLSYFDPNQTGLRAPRDVSLVDSKLDVEARSFIGHTYHYRQAVSSGIPSVLFLGSHRWYILQRCGAFACA